MEEQSKNSENANQEFNEMSSQSPNIESMGSEEPKPVETNSKKKIIVTGTICLAAVAVIISIIVAVFSKHPIEKFVSKMAQADSYQVTMTISDMPLFGTITAKIKVDGNIQYTSPILFNDEEYIETIGDTKYYYTKNDDGKWMKTQSRVEEDSSSITDVESMLDLFDPKNYEKVKGEKNAYKQKNDVTFENYENVVIYIDENSCTIEMTITSSGMTCKVKVVFSDIGEIELTLPKVE